MLYPSIQELLKLSEDENGNERLNKYTLVMATAKCARIITNDTRVRKDEKVTTDRHGKKEYKGDEKAVRSAVRELKAGEFKVVFEGDEDYDSAIVDVRALDAKLEEELLAIEEQEKLEKKKALEKDRYVHAFDDDDEDTQDLMNASEVYTDEGGFDERYEDPSISPNN
jgi:DNA-directed RNA polymerase subunit K/omega